MIGFGKSRLLSLPDSPLFGSSGWACYLDGNRLKKNREKPRGENGEMGQYGFGQIREQSSSEEEKTLFRKVSWRCLCFNVQTWVIPDFLTL